MDVSKNRGTPTIFFQGLPIGLQWVLFFCCGDPKPQQKEKTWRKLPNIHSLKLTVRTRKIGLFQQKPFIFHTHLFSGAKKLVSGRVTQFHLGVSLNGGTPISHPKMIILSRKNPMGLLGKPTILGNPHIPQESRSLPTVGWLKNPWIIYQSHPKKLDCRGNPFPSIFRSRPLHPKRWLISSNHSAHVSVSWSRSEPMRWTDDHRNPVQGKHGGVPKRKDVFFSCQNIGMFHDKDHDYICIYCI